MKTLNEKVELVANVAIIIAAVFFLWVFVQKTFFALTTPEVVSEKSLVGTKLNLKNIDSSNPQKTVVLALSSSCHFCTESAPFYQRLAKKAGTKNIKLIVVMPQNKEDSEKYLARIGIFGVETSQESFDSINVRGTPTLFILNADGEIIKSWIGKLNTEKENEVIEQING